MIKSFRVGTVYGIPFRLDVTFLAVLPVFAWLLGRQIGEVVTVLNRLFGTTLDPAVLTAGPRPFLLGLTAVVAVFGCVTLHELGHSVVAIHHGYEVESITLWLLGGIAKPAERPQNWLHELQIAVAGPAVNVAIAAGCAVVLAVAPLGEIGRFLLLYLALLNVGLAAFNMLPAFPLDGGRVLRALLARNRSRLESTRIAASVGKGLALVLGIVGLFAFNFVLVGVALFVYIAATSESRQMMLGAAFEGLSIEDVMTPAAELTTVDARTDLTELLDVMLDHRHTGYPVLDGEEFVGVVTLADVRESQSGPATVADAMTPRDQLTMIAPDSDVMDAFREISSAEVGRLPVVEDGRLCGLVTRTDLMRAFRIVTERQRFEEGIDEQPVRLPTRPE
ncbi:site-2 protease family protein [Halovenus sp. HT40]|uniref:site-2 protease family protein n=1 Tax=Halovenus sp. HT40 TaxID=3126691 RepID=UPI00300F4520